MQEELDQLAELATKLRAGRQLVNYPNDFKQRVVALLSAGIPIKDVARALGLGLSTVQRWRQTLRGKVQSRPRSARTDKPKPEPKMFTFAPLVAAEEAPASSPTVEGTFRLEFESGNGKKLSVSMPWHSSMTDSVLGFVRQTMGGGEFS